MESVSRIWHLKIINKFILVPTTNKRRKVYEYFQGGIFRWFSGFYTKILEIKVPSGKFDFLKIGKLSFCKNRCFSPSTKLNFYEIWNLNLNWDRQKYWDEINLTIISSFLFIEREFQILRGKKFWVYSHVRPLMLITDVEIKNTHYRAIFGGLCCQSSYNFLCALDEIPNRC